MILCERYGLCFIPRKSRASKIVAIEQCAWKIIFCVQKFSWFIKKKVIVSYFNLKSYLWWTVEYNPEFPGWYETDEYDSKNKPPY